ncbi:MAG: InlB B-repeat-containing protein, partial [Candidatus Muiribacteriaceae bacterium]
MQRRAQIIGGVLIISVLIFFMFIIFSAGCGGGGGSSVLYPSGFGQISGSVRNDSGKYISDVKAEISGKYSITRDDGIFSISDIKAGAYVLTLSKKGYLTYYENIDVVSGMSVEKNPVLEVLPDTAEITAIDIDEKKIKLIPGQPFDLDNLNIDLKYEPGIFGLAENNKVGFICEAGHGEVDDLIYTPPSTPGEYTVNVMVGDKSVELPVTVADSEISLDSPQVMINDISDNSFTIAWSGVTDVDYFNIYENNTLVKSRVAQESITSDGLIENETRTIQVSAVSEGFESDRSEPVSVTTGSDKRPAQVTGVLAEETESGKVKLFWNNAWAASEYTILMYKNGSDSPRSYTVLKDQTEIEISDVEAGDSLVFRMLGKNTYGVSNKYSDDCIIEMGDDNTPPVVDIVSITGDTGDVTVVYDLLDNESDICSLGIYYSIDNGISYIESANVTGDISDILPNSELTFTWHSLSDFQTDESLVKLKIIPSDGLIYGTAAVSESFTVNNSIPLYTLNVNAGADGTASDTTGEGPYNVGETVDIEAVADVGYRFVNWTGDTAGMDDVDAAATTITMPAEDATVEANFEVDPAQTFNLTVNAGANGTASDTTGEGPYNVGETV